MGKLITIKDAMTALGVSRPTICSWIDNGVLHSRKINKLVYLDEDSVNALQDNASDIERMRDKLDRLMEQYKNEIKNTEDKIITRRHIKSIRQKFLRKSIQKNFVLSILDLVEDDDTRLKRDKSILEGILFGDDIGEIADSYGLTCERVRQIAYKMIRRLSLLPTMSDMEKSIKELNESIQKLEKSHQILLEENIDLKQKLDFDHMNFSNVHDVDGLYDFLTSDVDMSGLPARLCNSFYKMKTVGDIVKLTQKQILSFRNMGNKTLTEFEKALKPYGITFGFDVDGFERWYVRNKKK